MLLLVSYDITDDKRRTKVAKILEDFGERVQFSVFECELTESQRKQLQKRLKRYVTDQDSIRYYLLCAACRLKIEIFGKGEVTHDEPYYLA